MKRLNSISLFEVIDQLRFPLIVLVTFAHSYGHVADDFSLWTSEWNTYEFLKLLVSQTLVKVVVPAFFIIAGYLFFVNAGVWSFTVYKEKMLRRVKTLLIPYLIWNLLMAIKLKTFSWSIFWVFWHPAGTQVDWLGHEKFLSAPANMPLWFLRDLLVVSLLSPLIHAGVRKWGGWLLLLLGVGYLSGFYAFVPGISAYAVCFFTIGAFLGIRQKNLMAEAFRLEKPVYVISAFLGAVMMLTYHTDVFSSIMLCFRLTGAVAVFCLAGRLLMLTRRRIPQMVCDSAYFIYLAHYVFFLSWFDEAFFSLFGTSTASLSVHYLICPLVKAAVFAGLYAGYRWLKGR